MKKLLSILGLLLLAISMNIKVQATTGYNKTLVVFFSQTGNTKAVGNTIRELIGADIFELKASEPYPNYYHAIRVRAKAEQEKDIHPLLQALPKNIERYDTIFIGSPIWNYTIAQPIATFLGKFDFKGKTIIPFCTHGGGGAGHSASDIAKRTPGAKVLDGYASTGNDIDKKNIGMWLRKLNIIK